MSQIDVAEKRRYQVIEDTSKGERDAYAQHLTPKEVALLAVSMFDKNENQISCLDLGCGSGMLSIAMFEKFGGNITSIDGVELDPKLARIYEIELNKINHRTIVGDALSETPDLKYDKVILNPPYKKMSSTDPRQGLLPTKSPNLYIAFLMTALSRLKEHGECVAIIPRSWTNGEYFTPFRKWVFDNFSLDSFHIYNSRSEIFSDTSVLQEIMIVKFSRKKQGKLIRVSTSNSKNDAIDTKTFSATELISRKDRILRMSPPDNSIETTISDFKLCPSTGKIVDFRSRERIYHTYAEALADSKTENQIFRLIYAGNLKEGTFVHPREIGKSQWFRADQKKSFLQLIQPGIYVLVKRFTTKEEPRRVVTLPLQTSSPIALENHINFIHSGTPRTVISLPSLDFAKGLSIWLNSIYIDNWFRNASGSTQVNASDIKSMPCLSEENLISLGKYWKPGMKQEEVEERVRLYL